jgi:acyl-CoA oxidase
LETPINFNF